MHICIIFDFPHFFFFFLQEPLNFFIFFLKILDYPLIQRSIIWEGGINDTYVRSLKWG